MYPMHNGFYPYPTYMPKRHSSKSSKPSKSNRNSSKPSYKHHLKIKNKKSYKDILVKPSETNPSKITSDLSTPKKKIITNPHLLHAYATVIQRTTLKYLKRKRRYEKAKGASIIGRCRMMFRTKMREKVFYKMKLDWIVYKSAHIIQSFAIYTLYLHKKRIHELHSMYESFKLSIPNLSKQLKMGLTGIQSNKYNVRTGDLIFSTDPLHIGYSITSFITIPSLAHSGLIITDSKRVPYVVTISKPMDASRTHLVLTTLDHYLKDDVDYGRYTYVRRRYVDCEWDKIDLKGIEELNILKHIMGKKDPFYLKSHDTSSNFVCTVASRLCILKEDISEGASKLVDPNMLGVHAFKKIGLSDVRYHSLKNI